MAGQQFPSDLLGEVGGPDLLGLLAMFRLEWKRFGKDPGIDVSANGWDSDMIEYPSIFDHRGKRYMLYAGNAFGREGFGIASFESGGNT